MVGCQGNGVSAAYKLGIKYQISDGFIHISLGGFADYRCSSYSISQLVRGDPLLAKYLSTGRPSNTSYKAIVELPSSSLI